MPRDLALSASFATYGADDIVRAYHERGGQPAIAYGIVRDGELVHAAGFGARSLGGPPPDERTVFRIASMSKSFTASAIMLLRDEGMLALDDPASAYLPELAGWDNGAADAGPLTIRHLLTMTAGFPTDDPWGDRQQGLPLAEFDALLAHGVGFNWAPGTRFEYSNLGYAILGRIVAIAAGVPYDEFVRTRLLTPLRHEQDRIRGGGVPGVRARPGLPPRPGRLGGASVRPLRRVRPDGRRVLLRRRPGHVGVGLRGRVPAGS